MTRRLLSILCSTLVVASGPAVLVAGATAAHASTPVVPYELDDSLGVSAHSRMVAANGLLFVSQGDSGDPDVLVFDEDGNEVTEIDGMPGAAGMVASADGSTVYVALNNGSAISAISTTSLTVIGSVPVAGCPENLAIAAGRLFFSYGCQLGQWTSGVASIDLANPYAAPVVALTRAYSPQLVTGAGTYLVVGDVGVEPATVTGYDAGAGDGTLVSMGSDRSTNENLLDLAITPDSSQVVAASGAPYHLTEFAVAGMTQTHTYAGVAYPHAVALSPDGNLIAGGFNSYGDTVNLYDARTTQTLWQRATSPGPDENDTWQFPFDSVLPGALTFSSDGSKVFGLVQAQNGGIGLFSSVVAPAATNLRISAPSATVGHPITVTVATGVANESVDLVGTPQGGTATDFGYQETGADGTFTGLLTGNGSGTLRVVYEGDDATLPATATTTYAFTAAPPSSAAPTTSAAPSAGPAPSSAPASTPPSLGSGGASLNLVPVAAAKPAKSTVTVTMAAAVSRRGGIYRYRTMGSVHATATVTPCATRPAVTGTVQAYVKKHWVTVSSFRSQTGSTGRITATIGKAPAHTPLRMVLKVVADSHVKAATTTSKTFEIGT